LGIRGRVKNWLNYELTGFYIAYEGKIGQILRADQPPLFLDYRYRGNISDARNVGVEVFGEFTISRFFDWKTEREWSVFVNTSWIDARYINTQDASVRNKMVEMVPPLTFRTGTTVQWGKFSSELQWAYTSEHFSDATNARRTSTAVEGVIPAYAVMDLSFKYRYARYTLDLSINNVLDERYFTRRAEAYPGPGIIPADGRGFFATVQVNL
jgi:Fe(3+) dicitrate transport protein